MAQFTYYPADKLFNNIPPNIKYLNYDIHEFLISKLFMTNVKLRICILVKC